MNPRTHTIVMIGLAIVASAGAILNQPNPSERTDTPDDDPWLDAATYNVHQYWSHEPNGIHSLPAIAAVLRAADADIIGLQESEGGRVTSGGVDGVRWLARSLGYHYANGHDARTDSYGVALLSKWPIHDTHWLPLPAPGLVTRGALVAQVAHPDGATNVVVTHFSTENNADVRAAQAEALANELPSTRPLVVLGDFNTPALASEPAYAALDRVLDDAWIRAGLATQSGATQLNDDTPNRIDHVWIGPGWDVGTCATHGGPDASDHRAVACQLAHAAG